MLTLKTIVLGDALDSDLKQGKLVWNEWIGADKMISILEISVGLGAIGKVKERFEIVRLLGVDRSKLFLAGRIFEEQAFLNDFGNISTGQLHAVGKASLDLGEVVALLFAHFANDRIHVFLSGDDHPSATVAFGSQTLGNRLQVGHEFGVVGNILADLIDEKIEAEVGRLFVDPLLHVISKILDGEAVVEPEFIQHALHALAAYLVERLIDE